MTISIKRETLHQVIDNLSEPQLLELSKFVESLLSKDQPNDSGFEVNEQTAEDHGDSASVAGPLDELNKVIQAIRNTPPNYQAITPPTKRWENYVDLPPATDVSLDVVTWNQTWDTLEAEMEAESLAHEESERQENKA